MTAAVRHDNVIQFILNSYQLLSQYQTARCMYVAYASRSKNQRRKTIRKRTRIKKLVPCGIDGRLLLSGFQAVVTLTLTLDQVTQHAVVHQSSTSSYIPNVGLIEIEKTFCVGTDVRTY